MRGATRRTLLAVLPAILLAVLLAACSGRSADGAASGAAGSDDAAAREARAQVERTMNAFAAMDSAAFAAGLAEDVVGYEFDLESKPVRLGSRADAARFAGEVFAQLGKMGARPSIEYHATACRAAATLAACTVEFDFAAKMADGSTMTQPTRNTVVLRRGDDGWRWTHWHSSPAGAPAPAPAAPATPTR
jgi:ketosteroid isomerase-like protein